MELSNRHPGVAHLLSLFDHAHLPEHLQSVASPVRRLAVEIIGAVGDGPELSADLRKLLEAKDCFVRQAVIDRRKAGPE